MGASPSPTDIIGGASALIGAATQKSSPSSAAESSAGSSLYGNFTSGDFSLGGVGGTNGLILAGIAVVGIALCIFLWRKHK